MGLRNEVLGWVGRAAVPLFAVDSVQALQSPSQQPSANSQARLNGNIGFRGGHYFYFPGRTPDGKGARTDRGRFLPRFFFCVIRETAPPNAGRGRPALSRRKPFLVKGRRG
ncbi:MAG: hypothetical protein Kow0092_24240 [Deferrisomatales bacterium]